LKEALSAYMLSFYQIIVIIALLLVTLLTDPYIGF